VNKGKRMSILTGVEDLERHDTDREVKQRLDELERSDEDGPEDSDNVEASDAEEFISSEGDQ